MKSEFALPQRRSLLARLAHQVGWRVDAAGDLLHELMHRRTHLNAPVKIAAYAGYRTEGDVRILVRTLIDRPMPEGNGNLARLRQMMALYHSHELGGVMVRVAFGGGVHEAITDAEGYARFRIPSPGPLSETTEWQTALVSAPGRAAGEVNLPVLAPGNDDHWGVISDIDDTVLETGATNFLRNWRRVLIHNAQDRIPVPGAPELFAKIARDHENPVRPFFYVSSSPYNLYPLIADFMVHNHIPLGPMFLKDYGIDREKFVTTGHGEHKVAAIETILAAYPNKRFLLVGDSGQHDIMIYHDLARRHAGRFGACIIRDVDGECAKGEKARRLREIEQLGIPTYCRATLAQAAALLRVMGIEDSQAAGRAVAMEQEPQYRQLKSA